jgi:hypothetical protein
VLKVKGLILAAAMVALTAMPSAAQSLGLGVSGMSDGVGAGLIVDYSGPLRSTAAGHPLNWVGEFNFYPGDGGSLLMLQGGVRGQGAAGENLNWLLQGLVGFSHSGVDSDVQDVCDLFDVDCGGSSGAVLTFGGGVEYALNDRSGIRAQLDIPIFLGDNSDTATRFSVLYVLKMGR